VDEGPRLGEQPGIERLTVGNAGEVVADEPVHRLQRAGALEEHLTHVGDVEESCRLAHREVLGDAALVLDRHVPAGEIHHPGTQLAVDMIQRSGERHGHAPLEAEGGKNAADHRGRIRADQGRSPRGPGGTRVPSDAMHIPSLLNGPRPTFSFEFYPPKTAAGEASLMSTLNELSELEPGFVSVTCGA